MCWFFVLARGRIPRVVLLADDPTGVIAHEALVEHRVVIVGALESQHLKVCANIPWESCLIYWFRLILMLLWRVLGELRLGCVVDQLATYGLLSYLSVHVIFVSICPWCCLLNWAPLLLHHRCICKEIRTLHKSTSHWLYLWPPTANEAIFGRALRSRSHTHRGYIHSIFHCRCIQLLQRSLFFLACARKDHWLSRLNCCLLLRTIVAKTGSTHPKIFLVSRSFSLMVQDCTRSIQIVTS